MSDLCRKCGERERAEGQRWCAPCRAEYKRGKRAGNGPGNAGNSGGEHAGNAGNGEQAAQPGKLARAHDHAACHRELEMLRLDVERLKGELAQARMGSSTVKVVRVEAPAPRPAPPRLEPRGHAPTRSQRAEESTATPHGSFCMCFGCRGLRGRRG